MRQHQPKREVCREGVLFAMSHEFEFDLIFERFHPRRETKKAAAWLCARNSPFSVQSSVNWRLPDSHHERGVCHRFARALKSTLDAMYKFDAGRTAVLECDRLWEARYSSRTDVSFEVHLRREKKKNNKSRACSW